MNILYGIQATGNGHITRSKLLVKQLRDSGHKVHVILSGRSPEKLWDVEDLLPYDVFPGLTYANYKGKVHYWQTVKNLRLIKFIGDVVSYNTSGIDLVITDFDPVSAYIAKIKKINLLIFTELLTKIKLYYLPIFRKELKLIIFLQNLIYFYIIKINKIVTN